ncbi:unnamed protein product [Arctia plantaginis]|uniref:C2H2-type domain-containing protein n=1 Tax=Arctia plantaginis TaxID=874455 RepID=A0A8S1BG77_ARCPL|nr:unnamed protein product [Arctia plantaginis]
MIRARDEVSTISTNKHSHRFSLSTVTHTDIPSNTKDMKNNHIINFYKDGEIQEETQTTKQVNENVIYVKSVNLPCLEKELYLAKESNHKIDFLNDELEYQNENESPLIVELNESQLKGNGLRTKNTNINKLKSPQIQHEKSSKLNRIDLKLEELKFEVKYLNLEEQTKEVERKKIKYKNMKFQCDLCGVGFLTNDYFEAHQTRHTEAAGQYKCSVCSLHFKNQLVVSQHMLSHRRLFSCMVCGAQFSKWSNCTVHRQKCGGLVMFVSCETCSKVFSDPHSLKVHMRVHDPRRQFTCEHCGNKFKTKQRLAVHIRSHTGTRPFSCTSCSRSFTTNSNLRAHRTVHSDVSEHYCVECNTYYKTAKSLKRHLSESVRHIRDRNYMYKCKQCSKEFSTVKSLNSHVARHTNGLQELYCPQCNKTFSSKSNLTKHLKCIHKSNTSTRNEKRH